MNSKSTANPEQELDLRTRLNLETGRVGWKDIEILFARGMVMVVFALPSYPIVFKIIRDRFAYPKTTVRRDVINAYRLVFKHDRAGRLIDAQEFRHLKFHRDRFEPELLEELLELLSDTAGEAASAAGPSAKPQILWNNQ